MSDDELVRRYLLGDLPGDEREELEKRLLSNDDLFELAEAVEADILDDYDRGELAPGQRERVEAYLQASPEGRLRLAVVRGLAKVPAGRVLPFRRFYPEDWPARAAAIAAMLVMGVGAVLLSQWRPDLPVNQARNKLPAESPILHPSPPMPQERVAEVRPTPTPTPAPAPLPVSIIAIDFLVPRSSGSTPSFDIAAKGVVELQFQLREGDLEYTSYQVSLTQEDTGEEVTGNEGLKVKQSDGRLIVKVDASRFEEGLYSLEIHGVPSEGEPQKIESSEIEVRRR